MHKIDSNPLRVPKGSLQTPPRPDDSAMRAIVLWCLPSALVWVGIILFVRACTG